PVARGGRAVRRVPGVGRVVGHDRRRPSGRRRLPGVQGGLGGRDGRDADREGGAVTDARALRTAAAADRAGAGWALITSPDAVCYASGYEVPYETGPSPFAGGPGTALVAPDGTAHLIVVNAEEGGAAAGRAATVTGYEGFSTERPLHGWTEHAATVARVAAEVDLAGAVAVERTSFGWAMGEALAPHVDRFVPFDDELSAARMVKTDGEIAALRRCAAASAARPRPAPPRT